MNELQHVFQELQSGKWAEVNPDRCPCRGGGWLCSDLDTWHKCPIHGADVPHPEDLEGALVFRATEHKIRMYRKAYALFRAEARALGLTGNFKALCAQQVGPNPAPSAWVAAAENIADAIVATTEERRAKVLGFDSALEMRLTEMAAYERRDSAR
jgi:hypothetical protein